METQAIGQDYHLNLANTRGHYFRMNITLVVVLIISNCCKVQVNNFILTKTCSVVFPIRPKCSVIKLYLMQFSFSSNSPERLPK